MALPILSTGVTAHRVEGPTDEIIIEFEVDGHTTKHRVRGMDAAYLSVLLEELTD